MTGSVLLDWAAHGVAGAVAAGGALLFRRVREGERKQARIEARLDAVEKRDPSTTFAALRTRIEDLDRRVSSTQADVAGIRATVGAMERTLHLIHEHLMENRK